MEWHVVGLGVFCALVAACEGPGPFHPCTVQNYELVEYHGEARCSCDPGYRADPRDYTYHRGTWAGVVAPPGSFPALSPVTIEEAGGPTHAWLTNTDGSAFIGFLREGHDLAGYTARVTVAGAGRYAIPLQRFRENLLTVGE